MPTPEAVRSRKPRNPFPGFLHGETMLSTDEPDFFCVLCAWEEEAAYQEWQNSPVRAKQVEDLAGIIAGEMKTLAFQSVHVVEKPKSSSD